MTTVWLTGRTPSEEDYGCTVSGARDIVPLPHRIEALAMRNQLFCGDNLDVLRHCIADESIDLVYLDPPFKSDQNYNLLFREKDGTKSASQILAFEDTWEWNVEAERNYAATIQGGGKLSQIMAQFRTLLGDTDMLAYLSMMAPRLVELQRVLRPTGSIYLHCDPTASHYLKTLMDSIFAPCFFRSEIIWKRNYSHNSARRYGPVHDSILFYSKTDSYCWNDIRVPLADTYVRSHYKYEEEGRLYKRENITGAGTRNGKTGLPWHGINPTEKGRHWIRTIDELDKLDKQGRIYWPDKPRSWPYLKVFHDETNGQPVQDIWADLRPINSQAVERLGYPTQKPQALLERIIRASSNSGDVILDPFCGCGTAIEAAQKLQRRWIGIDITIQAMRVTRNERLIKLGESFADSYDVIYRPCDISAAQAFAAEQPFQFQDWAVEKLDGVPSRPRLGDRGIDGRLYFRESSDGPLRQIVASVKGGKLKSTFVRELQGAVARERVPMGVLITLNQPSKQMIRDAASSGFYTCASGTYPKIQIVTVKDILSDVRLDLPPIQRMDDVRKRTLAVAAASQMHLPGIAG
jgi:DNA modification methylase